MGLQCPPWEGEIDFSLGLEAGEGWLGTGWINWRKEQILREKTKGGRHLGKSGNGTMETP